VKIAHYKETPPEPVGEADASGITVRWVISEKDGAENFSMRVFEVAPGGCSSFHKHPWEHEVFILEGTVALVQEEKVTSCSKGDVVFIGPGERHQLKNPTEEMAAFICLVPNLESKA
jgi:quercetin dioxygenase-like cupin family protein